MGLAFWLYVIDLLDNMKGTMIFFMILYAFSMIIALIMYFHDDHDEHDTMMVSIRKYYKAIFNKFWAFVLMVIIAVFIPDKSTIYMMLGSSYLSQSNLSSKVSQALELKLDDIIKDLKKEKESK